MREVTRGKARRRRWARRKGTEEAVDRRSERPQGESRERSRCVTDLKQVGIM